MISSHVKITLLLFSHAKISPLLWLHNKLRLSCWKYFTRSLRSLVKYFSTLEEKFRISERPCNILYISTTLILIQSYTVHSDKQYFRCEFVQLRKTSDDQNSPCSCLDCCLWNFPLQLQSIPLTVATSLNIKWWSAEISSQLAPW